MDQSPIQHHDTNRSSPATAPSPWRQPAIWFRHRAATRHSAADAVPLQPSSVGVPRDIGNSATEDRAAIFIDKDGTLIEDVPYNVDPAKLRFTRNAIPALQLLAQAGLPLAIVTNQPGLAQGRFSRQEFVQLQKALSDMLLREAGVSLAGFYVCPHAPVNQSTTPCLCRKPAPGLLHQAAVAERYDLASCWMIGDILDDIEAGRRAGCRSVLVDQGNETVWRMSPMRTPHYRCTDLLQAARFILETRAMEKSAPTRLMGVEQS